MDHITGPSIVKLMRKHGKTIRGVAASMRITQKRVRHVRQHGVEGVGFVQDWMEALTGDHTAGWAAIARCYQ
jgi:hypothetical protein